eukprot:6466366-Amphidinium_carterae.1
MVETLAAGSVVTQLPPTMSMVHKSHQCCCRQETRTHTRVMCTRVHTHNACAHMFLRVLLSIASFKLTMVDMIGAVALDSTSRPKGKTNA